MTSLILFLIAFAGPPKISPVGTWHSSAKAARAGGVYFRSDVMGVVYQARNKFDGKCYVGKTTESLEKRKSRHKYNMKRKSKCYFHRALHKYGFDAFEWKVLMMEDNETDLNESEIACIKILKTKVPNGYNLTNGGDGTSGYHHSKTTLKKMGDGNRNKLISNKQREQARIAITAYYENRPGPMTGKKHSKQSRSKMKVSHKGQPGPMPIGSKHTAKTRTKMRAAWIQRKKRQQEGYYEKNGH